MSTPVLDAHRERLVRAFARDVALMRPKSLLDVGCGAGLLLAELTGQGVAVQGLEQSERRVADARARGLDVQHGGASALPFRDAAFDWVVIRHVLHHLDDPEVAVGEAWRVARSGVVLAEPCCDPSIPSQVAMARFDAFTSELLARGGHIHHPYLSAGRLIALVPGPSGGTVTRAYAELTSVPQAEVRELAEIAAGELGLGQEDAERVEEFARAAGADELSYSGSTAVFVRRA
jgi:SAM-dependent methyltransferase